MGNKTYDHNGREIKKTNGKNIRVSTEAWEKIRKHCIRRGIVMGNFVEKAAIAQVKKEFFIK